LLLILIQFADGRTIANCFFLFALFGSLKKYGQQVRISWSTTIANCWSNKQLVDNRGGRGMGQLVHCLPQEM